MKPPAMSSPEPKATAPSVVKSDAEQQFQLERYKYILQQLHAVNENVYRFLAIYQTLATALVGAGLALFVGYKDWGLAPTTVRAGIVALMWLVTFVAGFTILLVVVGVLSWLDYRHEECAVTDEAVRPGFRQPPQLRNFFRWYETYIVLFIMSSIVCMWYFALVVVLPAVD
jgi:hypothetical protein